MISNRFYTILDNYKAFWVILDYFYCHLQHILVISDSFWLIVGNYNLIFEISLSCGTIFGNFGQILSQYTHFLVLCGDLWTHFRRFLGYLDNSFNLNVTKLHELMRQQFQVGNFCFIFRHDIKILNKFFSLDRSFEQIWTCFESFWTFSEAFQIYFVKFGPNMRHFVHILDAFDYMWTSLNIFSGISVV